MDGKKVVILQSNYIPWKGYFDLINMADVFVFYDDVQYTVRDWRNRNKIKTPEGTLWLTIPCGSDRNRLIYEVDLKDHNWQRDHWQKVEFYYKKAKCIISHYILHPLVKNTAGFVVMTDGLQKKVKDF